MGGAMLTRARIAILFSVVLCTSTLAEAQTPATKQLMDDMEEAKKQAASDFKGARGQYARDTCGQKLGISAAVSDGREVARLYGAQKAIAWTDCVVDTLYPDPAKK